MNEDEKVEVVKILHINKEVANKNITNKKRQNFENLKFLHNGIKDNIYFYTLDNSKQIYCFFDIYFLVIDGWLSITGNSECNDKAKKAFYCEHQKEDDFKKCEEYFAYFLKTNSFNRDNNEENISLMSMAIRNSKTLKDNGKNYYNNDDLMAIFDPKGFAVLDKINKPDETKDKFRRFVFLYILGLAYNKKKLEFLNIVYDAYKNNNINKMLIARDDFLAFDLGIYLGGPVKPIQHQIYEVWQYISDVVIGNTASNIKTQISDLVLAAYNKQKDSQNRKWTILATAIAAFSLFASIVALIK